MSWAEYTIIRTEIYYSANMPTIPWKMFTILATYIRRASTVTKQGWLALCRKFCFVIKLLLCFYEKSGRLAHLPRSRSLKSPGPAQLGNKQLDKLLKKIFSNIIKVNIWSFVLNCGKGWKDGERMGNKHVQKHSEQEILLDWIVKASLHKMAVLSVTEKRLKNWLINTQFIIKRLNFPNHFVFVQLLIESDAFDIAL